MYIYISLAVISFVIVYYVPSTPLPNPKTPTAQVPIPISHQNFHYPLHSILH
jgi:hypothetical protein